MKRASVIMAILIVFSLVGFFAIAIQKANDVAVRTTCENNLKGIGMGFHNYAGTYNGQLPRGTVREAKPGVPPARQISWHYDITPYIVSVMDPEFFVNRKAPHDDPENHYVTKKHPYFFMCPVNPQVGAEYPFTHYVGISGVGKDAAWLPLDSPNAGVFGYERQLTFDDFKNGTANVLAVAETAAENGPWAQGGYSTVRGLDLNGSAYLGEFGQFNSFHGGHHLGLIPKTFVTQVLMADGSVRGLTNSISDQVLEAMATLGGGE